MPDRPNRESPDFRLLNRPAGTPMAIWREGVTGVLVDNSMTLRSEVRFQGARARCHTPRTSSSDGEPGKGRAEPEAERLDDAPASPTCPLRQQQQQQTPRVGVIEVDGAG